MKWLLFSAALSSLARGLHLRSHHRKTRVSVIFLAFVRDISIIFLFHVYIILHFFFFLQRNFVSVMGSVRKFDIPDQVRIKSIVAKCMYAYVE